MPNILIILYIFPSVGADVIAKLIGICKQFKKQSSKHGI